jgi:hypothetical protein
VIFAGEHLVHQPAGSYLQLADFLEKFLSFQDGKERV